MPELTDNQIADLRVLQHLVRLGADLVIIGPLRTIHFPAESWHTGTSISPSLDLDEFAELERRLLADGWSVSQTVSTDGGASRQHPGPDPSWTKLASQADHVAH